VTLRPQPLLAGMAIASLLALAGALYTQHVLGMLPCAWCVLQRLVFAAVAAAALLGLLLGLLLPGGSGTRLGAGLALVLAGLGAAAALWQHFIANASASCDMTLADRVMGATGLDSRFPDVFAAYASCADARADLLGLPYEFWSLALFALLALAALRVLMRPR
jgi:disulfide bond formation protein DsbB